MAYYPAEPFRIKSVEPVSILPKAEREKAMKAAERAGQRTADSEASAADGEPVILACGSLSYLGDVIRLVEKSYGTRTRGTGKEEK